MRTNHECLPEAAPDVWPIGKKWACFSLGLSVLFAILDFMDRNVLGALFPYVKAEYQLSDTQLGMLVSVVNISIAILVVPSGYLVDRWSRTKLMGIMTFVWSLATGACAFAGSYAHLFMARLFVGAGEAGYSPAAQSLLAASFPSRLRSTAMSVFMFGASVGTPLGLVVGAFIASHWGWRHAFGIVALPGLLGAGLCFLLKDYKNVKPVCGDEQAGPAAKPQAYWRTVLTLLTTPSLLLVYGAQASKLIYTGTVLIWLPSYFQRVAGMEIKSASYISALFLVASSVATLLSGPLLDWLRARHGAWAARWQAGACMAAFALLALAFGSVEPGSVLQVTLLILSTVFTTSLVPLGYTFTTDLSLPHQRGTAISLLVTAQNIFGMAVGPLLAGAVSDHFHDLGVSMVVMAGFVALAGALYFGVSLTYARDMARLPRVVVEF